MPQRPSLPVRSCFHRAGGALLAAAVPAMSAAAGPTAHGPADEFSELKQLSLAELMDLEVTTVSRRSEKLGEVASAIQVITGDAVRRSGATRLPEALRLASNLHVAQLGSGNWSIGARSFNGTDGTSNKLLVLIDGRSVYTPLFSGVFWDAQEEFLPDLDQIEVISGPGGSTWGANAVNGVINVLSKSARETQGGLLYAGTGTTERRSGGLRYGGALGTDGHYRVYVNHIALADAVWPTGLDRDDGVDLTQTGFRADWDQGLAQGLTLMGDYYAGHVDLPAAPSGRVIGGNLLGRWTRDWTPTTQTQVQAYYDVARRDAPGSIADRIDTFDLSVQHQFAWGEHHTFLGGLSYRVWHDEVRNIPLLAFLPASLTTQLVGLFLQDEIRLHADDLRLTLGSKIEHNDYSGADLQPSVRLAWLATPQHTLWTAVSRAVRPPSRLDRDFHTPGQAPYLIIGGENFSSEILVAYEAGWRGQVTSRLFTTLTAFYHDYDGLRTLEPPIPITINNGLHGRSHGVEAVLEHELTSWWRWHLGCTLLDRAEQLEAWSLDLNQGHGLSPEPDAQWQVRTALDLPGSVELDLGYRHIGALSYFSNGVAQTLPAYAELDIRLGWRPDERLELSFTGQNLLDRQHPEAGLGASSEIERSAYGQVKWLF